MTTIGNRAGVIRADVVSGGSEKYRSTRRPTSRFSDRGRFIAEAIVRATGPGVVVAAPVDRDVLALVARATLLLVWVAAVALPVGR
jgi:hypothetical protein